MQRVGYDANNLNSIKRLRCSTGYDPNLIALLTFQDKALILSNRLAIVSSIND